MMLLTWVCCINYARRLHIKLTKERFAELTIRHAILIPSYKEDIDTLRGTLDVLAGHSLAAKQYDVRWNSIFSSLRPFLACKKLRLRRKLQ